MKKVQILMSALLLMPVVATANTSSVFSPDVNEGDLSIEYRASYVPGEDGAPSAFAQRFHIQRALNDTFRLRVIGTQSKRGGGSLSYNYTRFEFQHQYKEDHDSGWDAAYRLELQLSDRTGRPDRFRIGWTGKVDLNDDWQFRANLMLGRQFGDNPASGVLVETREQLTRKFAGGRIGLEMFNNINSTADFGSFDEQEHQLGPIAKYKIGKRSVNASYLFGLSDGAPDDNLRIHLIYPL